MIKINLLPYKKTKTSALKVNLVTFILLLVIGNIFFWAVFFYNQSEISEYERNIRSAKAEIASLQPIYQEYQRMQQAKKEIERRIKVIDQLKAGRALVARSLYDLSTTMKEGVWLKTFKKKGDKFEIEGRALVNESISEFMENIARLPYMKNVELKGIQDVTEEGLVVKKFIVQGNMSL
ncbi:MAG: PilN domain-containing protein [Syntrophorhabdaceae bacterium]|nr:PilN domain-containing protein [Syntrophorhabdaceae bacterium]MDD4195203.1 PilN domain-containing protein [Syntrophorhabdaceae bacterium]HOC45388.1 PilN domain-containing protein [Syntrophorhabdaceae bacterium]